jgi:hypothetical protein
MSVSQNFPNIAPSLSLDFANVKALDSRVTFARASSARYYNGVTTTKAEENLVLQSQTFDNASWLRISATITANSTSAPDGTTTADTLTATASTNSHIIQQLVTTNASQNYSYSIYAKYSTAQYIAFGFASGALGTAWGYVTVDIQNGTITQTTNGAGASITISGSISSVGNGWYRITVLGNYSQTNTYPSLLIVDTSNPSFGSFGSFSWTATGTEAVFLWGAQVEQRSSVTAYTPTTTQPITNYIPTLLTATDNVARFDHNPTTGESLGLLIEEQRTNLLLRSEEFDNASWTKTRSSITANTIVAPDGTLTGDKLVEDSATGTHQVTQNITATSGVTYTVSIYAKKAEIDVLTLDFGGALLGTYNLSTGIPTLGAGSAASTAISASMTDVGNGFYRCISVWTRAGSTVTSDFRFSLRQNTSYTGDGYSGIYIWGASLEQGSFSTSYIKTEGSQVTRSADSASMTGANFSSWYNQPEGTFYQDFTPIGINIGGVLDRYSLLVSESGVPTVNAHHIRNFNGPQLAQSWALGSAQSDISLGVISAQVPVKVVYAYKTNNFAASRNGAAVVTDNLGVSPTGVAQLSFPSSGCNHIKKFAYYPLRLSNTQLQALTG